MAIISLAWLAKSGTVLWLLGITHTPLKDRRDMSPSVICQDSYEYEYKSCKDLEHYVTPPIPGESGLKPEFIGKHPFVYKSLYGQDISQVDPARLAVAGKLYQALNCSDFFADYDKAYSSLQDKDVLKFFTSHGLPRIDMEYNDGQVDKKRAKCAHKITEQELGQALRHLRKRI